jgi:pimeloyl-ACP methyl ester carboxylesterase
MVPQLARLKDAGADAIILVVNAPPGAQVMKSRERMGWTAPVVSHWGISGGRFPELAGPTAGEAHFIQTYSFFGKQSPAGEKVLKALMAKYPDIKGPGDVTPAVGVANAYDAMMLQLHDAMKSDASYQADATTKRPRPVFTCDMAKKIIAPTLLSDGERSPKFFYRILDQLEVCLPNHERIVIAGSSHTVPSESPDAYDQAVLTFLAKH